MMERYKQEMQKMYEDTAGRTENAAPEIYREPVSERPSAAMRENSIPQQQAPVTMPQENYIPQQQAPVTMPQENYIPQQQTPVTAPQENYIPSRQTPVTAPQENYIPQQQAPVTMPQENYIPQRQTPVTAPQENYVPPQREMAQSANFNAEAQYIPEIPRTKKLMPRRQPAFGNDFPAADSGAAGEILSGTGEPAAEPENETFEPEEPAVQNGIPQSGVGIIVVSVSSGRGAYPIKDARVVIDRADINDPAGRQELIAVKRTNESGKTEPVAVEAVPREYSLIPGSTGPFSTYFISATYEGYFPARRRPVDVFGGETSLLELEMIPTPEDES